MKCILEIPQELNPKCEQADGRVRIAFDPVFYSARGTCDCAQVQVLPEGGEVMRFLLQLSGTTGRLSATHLAPVKPEIEQRRAEPVEEVSDAAGRVA